MNRLDLLLYEVLMSVFCGQNSTNFWCHDFVFAAEWRIILRLKFDRFCGCLPYEKDHDFAALRKSTSFFSGQGCEALRSVRGRAGLKRSDENTGFRGLRLWLADVRSWAYTFFLTSAHPFSHERKAFFSRYKTLSAGCRRCKCLCLAVRNSLLNTKKWRRPPVVRRSSSASVSAQDSSALLDHYFLTIYNVYAGR